MTTTPSRDVQDLGRFGYAQELFRSMGGFSNFAISFSIISILTGAVTLYGYGLEMGGPLEMTLGLASGDFLYAPAGRQHGGAMFGLPHLRRHVPLGGRAGRPGIGLVRRMAEYRRPHRGAGGHQFQLRAIRSSRFSESPRRPPTFF